VELLQDQLVSAFNAARGVDIFYAHQPLAAMGAGV